MTKKIIFTPENPKGVIEDLTSEEMAQMETDKNIIDSKKAEAQAQEDLKASAKAKLIAGEKLTEEEANILVGV